MNIDDAKTYATEANLNKALAKHGVADKRHLVVCDRKGRFTAIFPVSECKGDMTRFARLGFHTIG